MRFEVAEKLDGSSAEEYFNLVSDSDDSTFYHSLKYLRFLASFIEASPVLVICREKKVIGALPAFFKRDPNAGTVLNSLPFFGSHGGVVSRNGIIGDAARKIREGLLRHLMDEFCPERDVVASTVITSPYETELPTYRQALATRYEQDRIAQQVVLPRSLSGEDLTTTFESRCRRSIRKALASNVSVRVLDFYERSTVEQMCEMHKENMERAGGPAKPKAFFDRIGTFFDLHKDYDVYVAEHEGNIVGALLVFYFNRTVEYFVPAVKLEYRAINPIHLILLRAMSSAVRRGFRTWNFGGTHEIMDGVYLFKRSFGARDYHYRYFTSLLSNSSRLLALSTSQLRDAYGWFYVVPHAVLAQR